jgi:hypothetical protein
MEDTVQGERAEWSRTAAPSSGKMYYMRHIKPETSHHQVRNLREMKTICTALDHIAMGRAGQAADVLSQRLKAVELATKENDWSRACFLELVEEDTANLVSTDEQLLIRKETEARDKQYVSKYSAKGSGKYGHEQPKWQPYEQPRQALPYEWVPNKAKGDKHPKGKGKDKEGKDKGKGKGKGK